MNLAKHKRTKARASIQQSTCAYCGVGCGVDIELDSAAAGATALKLQGTPEHPANFGRLCVKGTHLLDSTGLEGRLLQPQIKGQDATWQQATDKVATEFKRIIEQHGPNAVAFYVSGQLLTEDYYVANKLMKGYIGSGNIDTNSRLCMSSAVAGYKRAFGEDVVPCDYRDIEHTDYLVLTGSNAAWTHPVLYQRMERAKKLNPDMRVVVIDPRRTATTELADLFLNIRPGTDVALYSGLLLFASQNGYLDHNFIKYHSSGFAACLEACQPWTMAAVSEYCQLPEADLLQFYHGFCQAQAALSFYSMGINQSSSGVDKCNAIINAHLATGQLLKRGAGPFSITGQPNAMGGREVGGLANQLAAHMDIENPAHRALVQEFWQSPTIATEAGTKAVDMFNGIESGEIKAVWIMATNPVVSMPNRQQIKRALSRCELVVVSDCVERNDTLAFADVKLPATPWIEKDGTVTNSERRISRQRGVMPAQGQAKHDWQIICEVAQKMGFDGFDFTSPAAVFDEWARMTAYKNNGARQLDLSLLTGLSPHQYDQLQPVQWPLTADGQRVGKVFSGHQFATATGKANFIAVTPRLPQQQTCESYPLVMNSGRIRDQWHTMTRTGKVAALNSHTARPSISIHPYDAELLQVADGQLIEAYSRTGQVTAHATVTDAVRKGECFMPIHWNEEFASSANVANLYQSVVDPISGQPESKHAAVAIRQTQFAQFALLYSVQEIQPTADFWLKQKSAEGFVFELAFNQPLGHLLTYCQQLASQGQWIAFSQGEQTNVQCLQDGKLLFAAFFSSQPLTISGQWLEHLFAADKLEQEQVQGLLYAEPDQAFSEGPLVCSCFKVREKTITEAIESGANTVTALGERLKCGTNCGSCKSELSQLINKCSKAISVREVN